MIDSQGKLVRVSLDEEEEKVKTQALVKSSKLKREGTIRDPGRKEKNKRESFKKWNKKQEKEIDSLTSYPGPKYNTAQKYLQKILQKYFTYRQVPGYVNRYWDCMYKRRTTHLATWIDIGGTLLYIKNPIMILYTNWVKIICITRELF